MTIEALNALPAAEAREVLERCCGASAWVERMVSARPFASPADLMSAADRIGASLTPADWRDAFTHHPRIGDLDSLRKRFASTADLASREQASVATANTATLEALAEGNRAYEEKFGYIFIVCATGKNADEMLALLRARMPNDPDTEMRVAAGEQMKITQLRLDRLMREGGGG